MSTVAFGPPPRTDPGYEAAWQQYWTPYAGQTLSYDQNRRLQEAFDTDWTRQHAAAASRDEGPQGGDYAAWIRRLVGDRGTQAKLRELEPLFTQHGVSLQKASDQTYRGRFYWPGGGQLDLPMEGYEGGGGQFTDPLTAQYERLLQAQTGLYGRQQAQMEAEAARQETVRTQTAEAAKRLMDYLNQRVGRLQGPAYTGAEGEVFRTQALEPIERDRQAALKRALDNVGSRGFDPSSGIAQDLFNQVNRTYDTARAATQGNLAYSQIQEQRSREQEAQQLLQYLTQLPLATARGDLDFVNYLQNLVAQPGTQGLTTAGALADLPVQRAQLAMQTLGLGGTPLTGAGTLLALLQNSQFNRQAQNQTAADFWRNLGLSVFGA